MGFSLSGSSTLVSSPRFMAARLKVAFCGEMDYPFKRAASSLLEAVPVLA